MAELVVEAFPSGNQFVRPKAETDYATVHDGAGFYLFTRTLQIPLGQTFHLGQWYYVYRQGWIFDTSALPSNAIISSAKISFKIYEDFSDTDFDITLVSGADIADAGLVWGDYGDLLNDTLSMGSKNTAGLALDTWYDINLNGYGLIEITKGGITKFGVRSSRDISNMTPTGAEYVDLYSTSQTGRGVKLTVTYLLTSDIGYIWEEDTKTHLVAEDGSEQSFEGTLVAAGSNPEGSIFAETTYFHSIDEEGDERRTEGVATGDTGPKGTIFTETDKFHVLDESAGAERTIAGE